MPSRVVHVRLDDWALLGCHDILKTGKGTMENIPMATIVRQVINALVRNMQLSDKIPTYSIEERLDRLNELYKDEIELDLIIEPDDIVTDAIEEDAEISDIVKAAMKHMETEGEPQDISQPVEITTTTVNLGHEDTVLDLKTQDYTDFRALKKKAPKDRFIEWAEGQEILEIAVAICYTSIPQELWGSDTAEEIIQDLLKAHREPNDKPDS